MNSRKRNRTKVTHKKKMERAIFLIVCSLLFTGSLARPKKAFANLYSEAVQEAEAICETIDGEKLDQVTAPEISITYNKKKINTSAAPIVQYGDVTMMALHKTICKQGPKVLFEKNEETGHIRLVWQNHVVTFYLDEKTFYADGQKYKFQAAPFEVVYRKSSADDILVPMEMLCKVLGFNCQWEEDGKKLAIKKQNISFSGKKHRIRYPYSLKKYAKIQYRRVPRVSYSKYRSYLDPAKDKTAGFQFLRVDRYRNVDTGIFKRYYKYLIEDYCREMDIRVRKSCLYNKANVFLKAAKKYNLDPVYLVSQTFLESAYGTSELACGNRIKKVARRGYPRTRSGKFLTKKIKKSVKVYNLYGIKAYDNDPFVGGTSYAYYHKWTSVTRAIYGAASYLSGNYIRGRYHQNTIYKMRFSPTKRGLWHQYATAPYYAESIGLRMYWMSTCYAKSAKFLYDFPRFS